MLLGQMKGVTEVRRPRKRRQAPIDLDTFAAETEAPAPVEGEVPTAPDPVPSAA